MEGDEPKIVWAVKDPRGKPVVLTEDARDHIIDGHEELVYYVDSLCDSVRHPRMILQDRHDFDTHLYCCKGKDIGCPEDLWLKTVVRFDISDSGKVITAYFPDRIPQGDILWLPPRIKK